MTVGVDHPGAGRLPPLPWVQAAEWPPHPAGADVPLRRLVREHETELRRQVCHLLPEAEVQACRDMPAFRRAARAALARAVGMN